MENTIKINSNQMAIREYNGQRVVTFKDIDAVHGRKDGTARRNYYTNKEHFIEGVDYFVRNSYEAKKEFGMTAPNGLILITESGYLMLAKSFTDDLAWTVQRELVNNYFRGKAPEPEYEQLTLETSDYYYFPKTYNGEPVITLDDFEYFTGVSRDCVRHCMKKLCKFGTEYLCLTKAELLQYKYENPSVSRMIKHIILLKAPAVRKLLQYTGSSVGIPMLAEKKTEAEPAPAAPTPDPKRSTTDECIVALNVLRYIKHVREKWRDEANAKGDEMMSRGYAQEISAINEVLQSVGGLVAAGR